MMREACERHFQPQPVPDVATGPRMPIFGSAFLMTRQAHLQNFKAIIGHSAKQSGSLQESRDCRISALLPAGFHGWAAGRMVHSYRAGSQRANRSRLPRAEAESHTCKESIHLKSRQVLDIEPQQLCCTAQQAHLKNVMRPAVSLLHPLHGPWHAVASNLALKKEPISGCFAFTIRLSCLPGSVARRNLQASTANQCDAHQAPHV